MTKNITPATGKLGVLTPGLGAVASTFIAGVLSARQTGVAPLGSVSQMAHIRLGTREEGRNPLIKDFAPLASLDDIVFGGWDPISANALEAARTCGVLDEADLSPIARELEGVVAMDAVFDQAWVSRLEGTRVKSETNKWDQAMALMADIENFRTEHGCDRLVMVWCGSTEAFQEPSAVHDSVEAFEQGLKDNDDNISPSQIYVYAALQSDVPFANGAPNLSTDLPCMQELSHTRGVPIAGKDFKTGQTLMKTLLAPGLKARMLGLRGWYSTNILGNRDGEVLDAPRTSRPRKSRSSAYSTRSSSPRCTPSSTATSTMSCASTTTRPRRQQGRLGRRRHLRLDGIPHADQDRLPMPRLDPGGTDRARPRAVHGPRPPGR